MKDIIFGKLKRIVIIMALTLGITYAANAGQVEITTSCGLGSGTYSCITCSAMDWVYFAQAIDAYYCG